MCDASRTSLKIARRQECRFSYMTCVVYKYKSSTVLGVYQNWLSLDFCCIKWFDLILAQSGRFMCFKEKGLFFTESGVLWSTYYIAAQLQFNLEWCQLLRCMCSTLFKYLNLEFFFHVHVQLRWNYIFGGMAFTDIIITCPRTIMFRQNNYLKWWRVKTII